MKIVTGLQAGFGDPLGPRLLNEIKEHNYSVVRLDCLRSSPLQVQQLSMEPISSGIQPLTIVANVAQLSKLDHNGILLELGNEPDIKSNGWTPLTYHRAIQEFLPIVAAKGMHLYVGSISNLNKRGFQFVKTIPWRDIPPEVGCSFHRYPEGSSFLAPHKPAKNREDELNILKSIVGPRPLACTEVGYHDGPGGISEAEVTENLIKEAAFFEKEGVELMITYQINDGQPNDPSPEAHYGRRRLDGTWKS